MSAVSSPFPSPALDDPVGESLRGHHAHLARAVGHARSYAAGVATFVAVPPEPVRQDWADLAALLGPGGLADLFSAQVTPPDDWTPVFTVDGLQLVHEGAVPDHSSAEVVDLGPGDVPQMLALAERTRPGPLWERTVEMGDYVGVRRAGELVAMAGERLHPTGWQEISAVCTAPEASGEGLASALVGELVRRAHARGDRAFLHVLEGNDAAAAVYRRLGFEVRREVVFRGFRVPG